MEVMSTLPVKNPSLAQFFGGNQPEFLFEDEQCVAFEEVNNKQAPVHFLVVPKKTISRLGDASADDEKLLGHMLLVAKDVAMNMGIDRTGYHVMIDENHRDKKFNAFHVFGRALHHMLWPVGPGSRL